MRIKEGYIIKQLKDHDIVVPIGEAMINFNGIMTLNETGKILFEAMQKDVTKDELISLLYGLYCAPLDVITADVTSFISKLREKKMIIE